jgi:hypothetical protein
MPELSNVIALFARYCAVCDRPISRGQRFVACPTLDGPRDVHAECMGGVEIQPPPPEGGSPVALAA